MKIGELELERFAATDPVWRAHVDLTQLRELCAVAAKDGARLAALWGSDERDRNQGFALHLSLATDEVLTWITVRLSADEPAYPDLADCFPQAARMQRAVFDLLGIRAQALDDRTVDKRPWLRHAAWPADVFPLRHDVAGEQRFENSIDHYEFVSVQGDGVHEIPVGPVHAGIIEPGHFRFSVVGEKVLRLEERFGYVHKGIEKRFEQLSLSEGARLAGRISGDSTAAYAWAYAMAVESITATAVPARALLLRAIALERERIANHLGDLGYLGNDGGLAFGLAQFMRLKEDVLRVNASSFGHRYAMDFIVPGGVERELARDSALKLLAQCDELAREVRRLWNIYEDHAGLQDRLANCGVLAPALAAQLGVIGLAGRASGQAIDLRVKPGFAPYDRLAPRMVTLTAGDVAARLIVRFNEIFESLRLIRASLDKLTSGEIRVSLHAAPAQGQGLGWVEGWRGEVIVAIASEGERIRRCHAHDPSWQNWPAIEHAVIGNIVPDFPLINKSFNLSYSGHDL